MSNPLMEQIRGKSSGTPRNLRGAMAIAQAMDSLRHTPGSLAPARVVADLMGSGHPDKDKVKKALQNNIYFWRKQMSDRQDWEANFEGGKAAFGSQVWLFLDSLSGDRGRLGLRLKVYLKARLDRERWGDNHSVDHLITVLDKMELPQLNQVVCSLEHGSKTRNTPAEALDIMNCSPVGVLRMLAWMDHGYLTLLRAAEDQALEQQPPVPTQMAPVIELEHYKSAAAEESETPPEGDLATARTGSEPQEETTLEPETEPEPISESQPESQPEPVAEKPAALRKRRFGLPMRWLTAALFLLCLVGATSPFVMEGPRAVMSARGIGAAYQYVLDITKKGNLSGKQLRDAAVVIYRRGDVQWARAILTDLAENPRRPDALRGDCYLQLGRMALKQEPAHALTFFERAESHYTTRYQRGFVALEIARTHLALQQLDQARYWITIAEQMRLVVGKGSYGKELYLKTRLAIYEGRYEDALALALEGYEESKENTDPKAVFTSELGIVYALLGNPVSAREYTEEALSLLLGLDDNREQMFNQCNYVLIYRVEGKKPPQHLLSALENYIQNHEDQLLARELHFVLGLEL